MQANLIRAAAAIVGLAFALPATSHDAEGAVKLGKVHFKVECNAAGQRAFNTAISYYHSFAWEHIERSTTAVLTADPSCGMAHWVRAISTLGNPFLWPAGLSPKTFADGQAALDAARKAGLGSQRERDYADALAVFFRDHDKLNHRTRAKALEDAMLLLAQRYPADREATILHALILSVNFDPNDKKYTNQLQAARILEPIMVEQPEHPGVAHFLIHSYDYPPIAHHGLEAAKRYSKIAPDSAHAQHMPSHVFTRVGAWRESIESNVTSAKVDGDRTGNSPHAYDYMVYAHLQLGQDVAARKVTLHALGVPKKADVLAGAYAYAAMPARLALERGAWKDAADLPLEPAAYEWKKYPQAEALNAFARGIGAARMRNPAAALAEAKRLEALRDAATGMRITYWAEQIDIQVEIVRGLAACAEGRQADCLATLRKAADREDATEKHVVTPGLLVPAREILAQALLEAGSAADALKEFETVLGKEPNRYRATLGAAQAAQKADNRPQARLHYTRLLALARDADTAHRELADAKQFVAGQ